MYDNFVIYQIKHNDSDNCYIGSTCNFSSRKSHHKKNCTNKTKKSYWSRLYRFIRDNGGWGNFKMDIIESFPCNTNGCGKIREQYHIDLLSPSLNSNHSYKFIGSIDNIELDP